MSRAFIVAVVAATFASGAAACGGGEDPVRIGVLTDCSGLLASTRETYLAGAVLPLLERGGERTADGGVSGAEIAGRPAEVIPACTEVTYIHLLVFAVRRLVEADGVDIVVGPIGAPESVAFREIASRYPDVTFVSGVSVAQEATLRDPQPNFFRFMGDGAQTAAGLGTYAYEDLGWRHATVVAEPFSEGFELSAGFVAEFCALGGTVERDWEAVVLAPKPAVAAARHAKSSDGVLLAVDFFSPLPYLTPYAAEVGDEVSRRLLLVGSTFFDARNLEPPGAALDGTVLGGFVPLDPRVSSMRTFARSFAKAFPELPPESARQPVVAPINASVEAVVAALEKVDGDLEPGQSAFRKALAATDLDVPFGHIRLDANRQARTSAYLERVVHRNGVVGTEIVRTIPGVEQSFGEIFTTKTPPPTYGEPTCERRIPPPWAR
jgi:branched-chain amino acid transport system substrate-binding protein